MNTHILRAKQGKHTILFYNDGEYITWKNTLGDASTSGWTIKYFKGLGTSTSAEFKEYFANKKVVDFHYSGQSSDEVIDMVFNKKRPDDRKQWLEIYDKNAFLDTSKSSIIYEEFMNNEMRHFSIYDCARSIPNGIDGLKTSLRKILFAAFKRKLTVEIKVAQFSGYISEHCAYHHGESSLNGAIINMAQTFMGSNNINLLEPRGQFGSRLAGGDDSASERYIFTLLNKITRRIFPEVDDAILNYLNDDGTSVEPDYYVPIIPFALINGISGIGTGFSCNIPSYNPKQIIAYLKSKLCGETRLQELHEFVPYYEGFRGTIVPLSTSKTLIKGCYTKISDDCIRITELPVGTWTMPYITFLEGLLDGTTDKSGKKIAPTIKDMTSLCTEVAIDIVVVFPKDKLAEYESAVDTSTGINGLEKILKLTTTVSTTNMHMFDSECKLRKYENVCEIIEDFYEIRMNTYKKRKLSMIENMEKSLVRLSNRAKYIMETLDGTVDLRRKTGEQVTGLLAMRGYDCIDGDYKYLTKMPMDSVTQENIVNILREKDDMTINLEKLRTTEISQIWLDELNLLENDYDVYKSYRENLQSGDAIKSNDGSSNSAKPKSAGVKKLKTKPLTAGGSVARVNDI